MWTPTSPVTGTPSSPEAGHEHGTDHRRAGGIGKQTAITLARQGWRVHVSGRDATSGADAVRQIAATSDSDSVRLLLGDLSTRSGVRAVALAFQELELSLDVLINNAGLAAPELRHTMDGLEYDAAVNVMAPFLLTTLLWPTLLTSSSARVVTLTGGSHPTQIDLGNLQAEQSFSGLATYSHAKVIMMAVMREYAERTRTTGITVNVCYPGQARTKMTGSVTAGMLPVAMRPLWPVFRFVTRPDDGSSAAKASRSSVYLATSSDVPGRTGLYVDKHCEEVAWPSAVDDPDLRRRLFAIAEEWAQFSATASGSTHDLT